MERPKVFRFDEGRIDRKNTLGQRTSANQTLTLSPAAIPQIVDPISRVVIARQTKNTANSIASPHASYLAYQKEEQKLFKMLDHQTAKKHSPLPAILQIQ
jgi:hypothetical protein